MLATINSDGILIISVSDSICGEISEIYSLSKWYEENKEKIRTDKIKFVFNRRENE